MPTEQQGATTIYICQSLSNMLQSIHLFRYDSINRHIYLIAGINEGIEIMIFENGRWEFIQDD